MYQVIGNLIGKDDQKNLGRYVLGSLRDEIDAHMIAESHNREQKDIEEKFLESEERKFTVIYTVEEVPEA